MIKWPILSFFENKKYWIKELSEINSNIPVRRINLIDAIALDSDSRYYTTKLGNQFIPDDELEYFKNYFSPEMFQYIKLPIVILQRKDIYEASGSKIDAWIIERIMGYEDSDILISIPDYKPKHTYYYTYQINRIRKLFPTICQIAYTM